ncbi:MAG: fibronectin type III domain-containing protein, partial [Dehalococcoidia bacterium]|nr:fibronectin type III domain-containing protein [Dehalococcoidia bacterium]
MTYNHEDPGCGYDATETTTACTYRVTVVVFDGAGGSDARAVDINVDDIREAPSRPKPPVVRATEENSRSLEISWQEPANTGSPITGYDIRFRKVGGGAYKTILDVLGTAYTLAPVDDENTTAIDERLEPNERYQVVVRAKNDERESLWSPEVTARTNRGNDDPVFDDRDDFTRGEDGTLPAYTTDRSVKEDARPGQAIGKAVAAIDGNNDRRTYKLVATDSTDDASVAAANKFDINESTGQILTKAPLNHEDTDCGYDSTADTTSCIWTVRVQVTDGLDEHRNTEESPTTPDDTITVRITVEDVNEPPLAPTVTVTSSTVSEGAEDGDAMLTVTWDMPRNSDIKPPVTEYVVECTGPGITTDKPCPQPASPNLAAATNTYDIEDLNPAREYRVRVQAKNDEGEGAWSAWVVQRTSRPGNEIPTIITDVAAATFEVAENARAGSLVGPPIVAEDGEDTTVTYRLDGPDADVFNIGSRGQIVTRSTLSHEDLRCYDETNPEATTCTYTVRVKISDRQGGAVASPAVTISVTDESEPPMTPPAPRVTSTKDSGQKLEVIWTAPRNEGPPITDYDVRYRKAGETDWIEWPHGTADAGSTVTKTTITRRDAPEDADPLEPRTRYEVEVRAENTEGESGWSRFGQGTTGASNSRPQFENTDSPLLLEVDENTRGGQNIGSPVSATDADRNRLTYKLEGPAANSFSIVSSSGQIRTKAALDYEERSSYSLTVVADDGQKKGNSAAAKSVTITVRDKREPPSPPPPPRVSGVRASTDSVRVTWDEPQNTGESITHYNVRYGESGSGGLGNTIRVEGVMDRSIVITGLTPGTRYEVQVRPESPEGHPDWSRSGFGSPNPDVVNQSPRFSSSGARTFSVEENSVSAGDAVGDPVTAVDPDLDQVTHTLEGTDATSFTIDSGSGQIRTTRELNHEERSRYSVTVKATDTRGGSVTVGVTITVTDVDEPPNTPFAPAVTAVSSASLQASWQEPANTGPSITDYDYRYRSATDSSWTEVTNTTIAGTTVTIERLTASTSYEVQVRARNAEGASDWSPSGISATNAPGANNPPVFSDGAIAARSVSATASAGANIGAPVTATDADPGDTLTYSLGGRDAASFAINTANGQLLTKIGVTLLAGETYTVEVSANDGTDVARITVLIEVTAAPPNNPPAFSEGASTTRSVSGTARGGTTIGRPVTATDSDPVTTLTYILEGTNAASFNINSSTGQLLTRAGITLPAASFPVTVVARDQLGGSGRITVTITIVPNVAPVFASTSTARSVNENVAAGTAVGSPVTATDADN